MADFPAVLPLGDTHVGVISPVGACSIGIGGVATPGTQSWAAANLALFVPFRIAEIVTVYQMACGTGTATTGNFDLGIYDASGNRLVSTGSTAKTTATSDRVVDVTDTQLLPGMYYLAMAVDTNGAAYFGSTLGSTNGLAKLWGLREVASSFPLPSTVTLATSTSTFAPLVGAFLRSE